MKTVKRASQIISDCIIFFLVVVVGETGASCNTGKL